jgi:O-acetyl-ADP-ribose deacetylase (regulator of RNase III)
LSGRLINKVIPHQGWVWSVSFSPDGQLIATVGLDATAPLLDLSGGMIVQLKGQQSGLNHSSFSPDGKHLVTASSEDGKARLWTVFGQQIAQLDGHQDWVLCVTFSPDGQVFVTADEKGSVCLWDLLGRQVAHFNSNQGAIYDISFSPDGRYLATAGKDSTVRLWRVEGLEELLVRGCEWLKDFFVTHPEELEKLGVCQKSFECIEAGKILTPSTKSEEGFLGEFFVHDKLVKIYQGDITNLVTDVIVSDDTDLKMPGGVSWRIHEIGGDDIYQETRNLIPWRLGDVAITKAGKLQAKTIFHGVVLDWHNEILPKEDIIQRVIHNCLEKADEGRFKRIAFPLLGTGSGGFSPKLCWEITLRTIVRELSTQTHTVSEVIIVLFEPKIVEEVKVKSCLEKIEKVGLEINFVEMPNVYFWQGIQGKGTVLPC